MPNQAQYSNPSDPFPDHEHSPRSPPPPKWKDMEGDFDPYQEGGDHSQYSTGYTGYKYNSVPVTEGADPRK